jgi:hypothetical protein
MLYQLFVALAVIWIALPSFGETYILKSGDPLEGRVDRDDGYVVTLVPYGTVGNYQIISKSDIVEVRRDSPKTLEFFALEQAAEIHTALSPVLYDQFIERRIPSYLKSHSDTPFRVEINTLLTRLKQDRMQFDAGKVKVAGVWLDRDEVDDEKYQMTAALVLETMESNVSREDWFGALNTFHQLEVSYPFSRAFVEGVPLALGILDRLQVKIYLMQQESRIRKLANSLKIQEESEAVRAQVASVAQQEKEKGEITVRIQRDSGVLWPDITPKSEDDFEQLRRQMINQEMELSQIHLSLRVKSIEKAVKAREALKAGNCVESVDLLMQSQAAWGENQMIPVIAVELLPVIAQIEHQKIAEAQHAVKTVNRTSNPWVMIYIVGGVIGLLSGAIFLIRRFFKSRRRRGFLSGRKSFKLS